MRPEHTEANKLIDIAETGDREAYRSALKELEARDRSKDKWIFRRAKDLATWQYQMYQRYHRVHAWRAEWTAEKRRKSKKS